MKFRHHMPVWAGLVSIKRRIVPELSELSSVQDLNPGPPDHEAQLLTAHQQYQFPSTSFCLFWGANSEAVEDSLLLGYNAAVLDSRIVTFLGNITPSSYCPTNTVISQKKRIFKFLAFYEAWSCESPLAILYCHSVLFSWNNANCSNLDLL
jgi:hypothetical protein